MLAFTNMRKHHTKYHTHAHAKRSEIAIMTILASRRNKNGLKITDISKRLSLPPSAVTPVINGLEEKGMVQRQNSPEDRRIVLVSLTKAGHDFFEKKQKFFLEKSVQLVEYLGEEDAKEFVRLFGRIFEFMDKEFKGEE